MKNIQILQAYRGIAAVLVVLFHIVLIYRDKLSTKLFIDSMKEGFIGVEFFFILSGFIIFYVHHQDFRKKRGMAFFRKRFRRIYPPYWASLVVILIGYAIVGKNVFHQFQLTPLVDLRLLSLFPQWPHIIAPAWTLSYEVFFYLLLGAALLFLSENVTIILFALYAVFLIVYNYFLTRSVPPIPANYFTLNFLFGTFAAWTCIHWPMVPKKIALVIFSLSLIYLGVVWYIYEANNLQANIYRPLIFGIATTTLIISSVWLERAGYLKPPRSLLKLGEISYSLYLLHSAIITFAVIGIRDMLKIHNILVINLSVIPLVFIILAATWAFHVLFERPFMRVKQHPRTSPQAS